MDPEIAKTQEEGKGTDPSVRAYADMMMEEESLKREKEDKLKLIGKKKEEEEAANVALSLAAAAQLKRRNTWYQSQDDGRAATKKAKTDEELDAMLPQEGYEILEPPASMTPASRKLLYQIPEENRGQQFDVPKELPGGLLFKKPEEYQYFGVLLNEENEEELSLDERIDRKIMKLLLKVKNGSTQERKTALRQFTRKAWQFGAWPLFSRILPLLMQPTLEDQERPPLLEAFHRVCHKLGDLVCPYVRDILVVTKPLLIDEDYYARVVAREIISSLSKAAGLATMLTAMLHDMESIDGYVRDTAAIAFSVVASALGVPALLPFLKALCQSKKSWQARHTGVKIVQQIAVLFGCDVLPHLRSLAEIIEHRLDDENQEVRTITASSLAALAEAATPNGIESFRALKNIFKFEYGKSFSNHL